MAALLCVELELDGLAIDRPTLDAFLTAAVAAQSSSTSSDASVTPSPSGWGGDLLFAMGSLHRQPRCAIREQ